VAKARDIFILLGLELRYAGRGYFVVTVSNTDRCTNDFGLSYFPCELRGEITLSRFQRGGNVPLAHAPFVRQISTDPRSSHFSHRASLFVPGFCCRSPRDSKLAT
jgi:hypothetical protein